ncbi:kinase-like protein [Nemania diffusa]|nr:kinase-like protein [Nemania diffusa]
MSERNSFCSLARTFAAKIMNLGADGEAEITPPRISTAKERGGYHPFHPGDLLNKRYEVVHMLESGTVGLVFLCHDSVAGGWKFVKIMTVEHSADSREEKIYGHLLKKSSLQQLRQNHLLIPSERFWATGPDGRHYCIVLPVLGPTVSDWRTKVTEENNGHITDNVKRICGQIIQAVHFLHQSGVCHGDLKPENVRMEIQSLDKLSKAQVLELLVAKPVSCELESESSVSLAPDVVLLSQNTWQATTITGSAFIVDFGMSYLTNSPPAIHGTCLSYAAPEIIWQKTFQPGSYSDIWSLATTLYELVCGTAMIDGEHHHAAARSIVFFLWSLPEPYRCIQYGNPCYTTEWPTPALEQTEEGMFQSVDSNKWECCPCKWEGSDLLEVRRKAVEASGYSDHFEASIGKKRESKSNIIGPGDVTDEEQEKVAKDGLTGEDVLGLADLLRKMLHYNPARRMSIEEVVNHPWLGQHVRPSMITKTSENKIQRLVGVTSLAMFALFACIFQLCPFNL